MNNIGKKLIYTIAKKILELLFTKNQQGLSLSLEPISSSQTNIHLKQLSQRIDSWRMFTWDNKNVT